MTKIFTFQQIFMRYKLIRHLFILLNLLTNKYIISLLEVLVYFFKNEIILLNFN